MNPDAIWDTVRVPAPTLRAVTASALAVAGAVGAVSLTPTASADALGYLVNITVRPGYNFPSADAAVAYGYGICDRVRQGAALTTTIGTVKSDINTNDDYQALYLVNQAVDELCPELIWQLRRSAANYTGGPDVGGRG